MCEQTADNTCKGKLFFSIFKDIEDMKRLKEIVYSSELEVSLLKPTLLVDYFQLSIAAFRSAANYSYGTMKTKKIVSEVLYNLSPSRNIAKALETFTPENSDSEVIVLAHIESDCELKVKDFLNKINGDEIPVDQLHRFSDINKIKDLYGIRSNDLSRDDILSIVVAKMAAKELG